MKGFLIEFLPTNENNWVRADSKVYETRKGARQGINSWKKNGWTNSFRIVKASQRYLNNRSRFIKYVFDGRKKNKDGIHTMKESSYKKMIANKSKQLLCKKESKEKILKKVNEDYRDYLDSIGFKNSEFVLRRIKKEENNDVKRLKEILNEVKGVENND